MSTQFILPGRQTNPLAHTKLNIAKAYALSRSCNPRNVEFSSYGLWCQYWMELTSDSRYLIVIPQHLLYYVPTGDSDEESSNDDDALANTTLSTIASGASTRAEKSAEEILPDFAIIRVKFRFRDAALRRTWRNVKIQYAGVPLLAEIKRAGSRSLVGQEFLKSTILELRRAQNDLFRQAAYLFTMHPRQHYVVLVACSGIYWTCRIADRQTVLERVAPKPSDDFEPDGDENDGNIESDEEFGEEGDDAGEELFDDDLDELDLIGRHGGPEEGSVKRTQSERHSSTSESESESAEEDYMEPVVAEAALALPSRTWSRLLCLDTAASNQKMFLIHARLQTVVRDVTGSMG
jgi:hypothetical protein